MNRDQFCKAMERRGYIVTNMGLITFLDADMDDGGHYTATWFFNPDGSRNENMPASWNITKPHKR